MQLWKLNLSPHGKRGQSILFLYRKYDYLLINKLHFFRINYLLLDPVIIFKWVLKIYEIPSNIHQYIAA